MGVGDRGDGDGQRTWTVLAALTWTAQRFEQAGIPSARLDAELLLAHATGLDRVGLYVGHDRPLDESERTRYRELVKRRLGGEPVAYLVGVQEFWSQELSVDGRVLIPRRETEHVVEEALRELSRPMEAPALADVGTGSGAIALAIKKERPDVRVVATDASAEALAVARGNAARLGLEVEFLAGDLLEPLRDRGPFDVIASNPPYIKSDEIAKLSREVQLEPRRALDGGADGLAVYRRLIPGAAPLLRPAGALVVEIGAEQAVEVIELCMRAGAYEKPRLVHDLAGLDRVVVARRR